MNKNHCSSTTKESLSVYLFSYLSPNLLTKAYPNYPLSSTKENVMYYYVGSITLNEKCVISLEKRKVKGLLANAHTAMCHSYLDGRYTLTPHTPKRFQ